MASIIKSSNKTIHDALRVLARDIQSEDGAANVAIAEAADRILELGIENDRLHDENAALREERVLWESKCHELIAPHYILNPDLRAAKFREALRFHPVLNLKAQAIIHAARKEAQP